MKKLDLDIQKCTHSVPLNIIHQAVTIVKQDAKRKKSDIGQILADYCQARGLYPTFEKFDDSVKFNAKLKKEFNRVYSRY